MARVNPAIFRSYDIRGVVGSDLDEQVAEAIGKAFGTLLRQGGSRGSLGQVAVGRDVRLSSPALAEALMGGLRATGLEVLDLGAIPTPLLYFYLARHEIDGGVIVTGSHNPPEFNGFKLCRGRQTLYEKEIQEIRHLVETERFIASKGPGGRRAVSVIPRYLEFLRAQFQPQAARQGPPLKIVVDAGNGTAGLTAPRLLRLLGYDVVELYCEPDGRFPHHHPDPTIPTNLADLQFGVRETKADLGVAYDGDSDRLGVVDERGEILWGDRLLILYARQVLREKPGAICIGDVKCSQLFFDEVASLGGVPLMWRTGHSLIKAKMGETGALLAGEMSGHFFFADRYFGFDDAVYATCRLLEVLEGARGADPSVTLSSLLGTLPPRVATPEIRLPCPDSHKHQLIHHLQQTISRMVRERSLPLRMPEALDEVITLDGLRVTGRRGWGLIRASNTEPALVLRAEAETLEEMERLLTFLKTQIVAARRELGIAS